jgi:L-aminopeptidase/D-esterase-like protein
LGLNDARAIIFDLTVAQHGVRPDDKLGYAAASNATRDPVLEGNVGAGIGATVGKILGMDRCMKGGVGSSSVTLDNGLCVGALVVVNSMGNVLDLNTGKTIAGAVSEDGKGFVEADDIHPTALFGLEHAGGNTTLGIVGTNAKLNYKEAIKMAEIAQDGISRTIRPVHTALDGHLIYAVATGTLKEKTSFDYVAYLASERMADAIVRAVRKAKSVGSIQGLADAVLTR